MSTEVFSVPVFLVVFRESLEAVIIVSVLLAFLKQTLDGPAGDKHVYKKLVRQVWLGTALGVLVCLVVGGAVIGVFYTVGVNKWEASELNWEGAFCLIASVIITVVGAALLRVGKMQEKWRVRLAAAIEAPIIAAGTTTTTTSSSSTSTGRNGKKKWLSAAVVKRFFEKYAMFALPFVTVLREGIEAMVFVAGVSFQATPRSVPLPVVIGLLVGIAVGYLLYKGGSSARLQIFLVLSTCLLYLVAAGLFSRAVWSFETQNWNNEIGGDAAETGDGPGSYDISKSVWHLNCCSPTLNGGGGWGFFQAILGWTNSATYGSVISYNLYWLVVILGFLAMRYHEVKGHWPLMRKSKSKAGAEVMAYENGDGGGDGISVSDDAGVGVAGGGKTVSPVFTAATATAEEEVREARGVRGLKEEV